MKKSKWKILIFVGVIGCSVLSAGCGKKIYYDVDPNTAEHIVDVTITPKEPEVTKPTTSADTSAPEETPTPAPTPDVSEIDTTTIVSEYKPNIDKTGLEVIDQNALGETADIKYLKGLTEKGAVIEIINGTTYVNGLLMVNKTYTCPPYYVPTNTHGNVVGEDYVNDGITGETWDAWVKMEQEAKAKGLTLVINSGYRSYEKQVDVFKNYSKWYGEEAADSFSARGGHSEHQSGLCFDLNSISDAFADTAEGKWIAENCQKFGFCIRFPKGQDEITGYKYESWHLRYVGTELAEILYNNGNWISMEDYFGLESHYMTD